MESFDFMSQDEVSPTMYKDFFTVNITRPAHCGKSPETTLIFAQEIIIYKEYGLLIWLPNEVFTIGP